MTTVNLENQVHLVIPWLPPLGEADPQHSNECLKQG